MIKNLRLFLVSNMYPSGSDPLFGVFVKNFKEQLETKGVLFTQTAVIKGKTTGNMAKLKRYVKYYLAVFNGYREGNFDVMYVHFLSHNAPILALLFFFSKPKAPFIINVHGTDVIDTEGKWIDLLNKKIIAQASLVVAPSRSFKKIVLKRYPFLSENRVFVSPSGGINTSLFYPSTEKKTNHKLHLGMVSRIDKGKGWLTFLKALHLLKEQSLDFEASIIGSGLENEQLLQSISDLDLTQHVCFYGLVPQRELVKHYHTFDLSVFPSEIYGESLGLVGLEAMACGTPVAGSNIPSIETYLEDGYNGFLFERGNPNSLAKKITYFSQMTKAEKSVLATNALESPSQFDADVVSSQLKLEICKCL
jgi:glycosyltransferase involved in cell wall biosynthesis